MRLQQLTALAATGTFGDKRAASSPWALRAVRPGPAGELRAPGHRRPPLRVPPGQAHALKPWRTSLPHPTYGSSGFYGRDHTQTRRPQRAGLAEAPTGLPGCNASARRKAARRKWRAGKHGGHSRAARRKWRAGKHGGGSRAARRKWRAGKHGGGSRAARRKWAPGSMAAAPGPRSGAGSSRRAWEGGLRTQAGSAASLGHGAVQIRVPSDHSVPTGRDLLSADDGQRPSQARQVSEVPNEAGGTVSGHRGSAVIAPDLAVGTEKGRMTGHVGALEMPATLWEDCWLCMEGLCV
ncbi:5E5 antigen-like [Sapajus apella]|uniref:5E5 antigen-like n=1 Tax=Sapajus apella TaxID=9515 RepID=A0A6J3GR19_SAPAP|nr:5E5 antigen-like [Sapajus apella]